MVIRTLLFFATALLIVTGGSDIGLHRLSGAPGNKKVLCSPKNSAAGSKELGDGELG
jgi:hypothetical protein